MKFTSAHYDTIRNMFTFPENVENALHEAQEYVCGNNHHETPSAYLQNKYAENCATLATWFTDNGESVWVGETHYTKHEVKAVLFGELACDIH